MGNGSGVSRGDRNRNAWLGRLRVPVPATNAIAGIDLAGKKQMVVVTDHDSKVIARRAFRCRAWELGAALDWAAGRAAAGGLARGVGAQRANPVCRARYQHLTSREQNKLTPTQAQTVIAAAILRHLHAVITTRRTWDPVTAMHSTRRQAASLAA